jgi:hypothetical protein
MGNPFVSFVCAAACLIAGFIPATARAQSADSVGIRAQGMGGAFTALADDASATWWNPAGLASGAYFNALIEYGRPLDGETDRRGVAVAFPALGLSYYRLTVSEIRPSGSTGTSAGGRQDPGTGLVRSLEVSQFGATVGQSVGGHLVLASTLKLLRAAGDTEAGLDIGAIVALGAMRAGVMVRNVREPTFGEGEAAMTLGRQVRAGVAVSSVGRRVVGATVTADADLRAVATALGDERRIGVGAEIWTPRRSLGLRGGISANTIGERRSAPSAGASLAVGRGVFVDGQITRGSDLLRRGWGADLRLTF